MTVNEAVKQWDLRLWRNNGKTDNNWSLYTNCAYDTVDTKAGQGN